VDYYRTDYIEVNVFRVNFNLGQVLMNKRLF
jgi:hypothetical protein